MSDGEIKLAEQDALAAAAEKAASEGRPAPTTVNIADHFLRQRRTRPLLLIHVLEPTLEGAGALPLPSEGAMVAIGLSFPEIKGAPLYSHVRYKINIVKARELFGAQLDFGDDIDDPEAP